MLKKGNKIKMKIPKIINRWINKWFCNHTYELASKRTVNWTNANEKSLIEIYYCKKCGKIHSICSSWKCFLKEEIKREIFLVQNKINKQLES